jgi:ABC-type branched-subunit amino acid transport system substrate-binding protein
MDGNLTVMDSLPSVDSKDPVMAAFSKAYKQASGQDATQIVPEWYATVFWLASVIEKVGTNGDAIRKALADTKSFTQWQSFKMPGIKFSCDSHHYCNTHMYLITGVNGQPTIVGEYEGGTKT